MTASAGVGTVQLGDSGAPTVAAQVVDRPWQRLATSPQEPDSNCKACAHMREHGWWGDIKPARTHCRDCHRYWGNAAGAPGKHARGAGLREMHCQLCHSHFMSPEACHYHLSETGCTPPGSIRRRDGRQRLVEVDTRWGKAWKVAFYGERPTYWASGVQGKDNLEAGAED